MAASDKRGLVENVKTLRRRLSLFGRTAFGKRVPPEVVDGEMEARRAEFADMLGGVDELGAGLAEHVAVLRAYFANSEALAEVAGTRLARERWAYLNAVVRRSAAGVLVECCLDPLRTLATATKRTVTGALASYDARRADYAHFLKRGPPKDAPDALDRARADYDLARRAALDAIAAALDAYRELVEDVACCVAAVHAELVAAAAGYVGEACDALPAGAVAKARGATRDCVKVGGPAIAPEQRSAAGRALAVLTGKRELADLKREAADLEDRRRLQADQARRSWETRSPARHALRTRCPAARPSPARSRGRRRRRRGRRRRRRTTSARAGCPSSRRGASPPGRFENARRGRAGPGAGFRVVALFDCAADEDGELALAKGDVVTVTDASDAGWWKGTTDDGASGVFLELRRAPRAPASPSGSRGASGAPPTPPDAPNRVVVALFDCVATTTASSPAP
ncbi:hypothetical protein JL722_14388 [Aureococcus anophagefferens]|nr:hypothetical protein JL722_14388 [Aureococcus anophagefferens]